MTVSRLGLGTVQLGLRYGISHQGEKPGRRAAADVIEAAAREGIDLLDTAAAYGDAESLLGSLAGDDDRFEVVTKLPPEVGPSDLATALEASLGRLARPRLFGLLLHDADVLLRQDGDRVWAGLEEARRGRVDRIGVSVYDPDVLRLLLDRFPLEIVQLPLSLYDRRFAPQVVELETAGIEVHVRSALLQGLLLMDADALPEHFEGLRDRHRRLAAFLERRGIGRLDAALASALSTDARRIVIGCQTAPQVTEVAQAARSASSLGPGTLAELHEEFPVGRAEWIDPRLWPVRT